ncbi:hypothetical protein AB4Y38_43395, partial [Paraburkholderia sp. EG285A]
LLESGVEINVIRGWLGHVSVDTTNRYAELTLRAKAEALAACAGLPTITEITKESLCFIIRPSTNCMRCA